ncbi:hypothetical protein C4D60_Mb06t22340 [Musa balbisiana]|uniref:Uncharacterized protein n=1 Tax=Musa balbisiana TaxID=52838 RepID=A0A4S8IPV7_MUSBA|nr:hypothetical protein C4D60_Mb06t22340 [Musa balbisiana]
MIRASIYIMPAIAYTCLVRLRNASGVTAEGPGASSGGDSPGREVVESSLQGRVPASCSSDMSPPSSAKMMMRWLCLLSVSGEGWTGGVGGVLASGWGLALRGLPTRVSFVVGCVLSSPEWLATFLHDVDTPLRREVQAGIGWDSNRRTTLFCAPDDDSRVKTPAA